MLLPYVAELLVGKSIGLHGVGNYRIALNVMQSITTLKDSLAAPARNRIAASMVALGEWGMDEARAFVEEEG